MKANSFKPDCCSFLLSCVYSDFTNISRGIVKWWNANSEASFQEWLRCFLGENWLYSDIESQVRQVYPWQNYLEAVVIWRKGQCWEQRANTWVYLSGVWVYGGGSGRRESTW